MRTKANEDKLNGEEFWENFNQDQLKFKLLGLSPGGSKVLFDQSLFEESKRLKYFKLLGFSPGGTALQSS